MDIETIKYIVKRFIYLMIVLFALTIIVFTLARVIPGDPVRMALGPFATEEAVEYWRKVLRLDRPLHEQYYYWLLDILNGRLGMSLISRRDVILDITERIPHTIELVLFANVIQITVGMTFGSIAGIKANKWPDFLLRLLAYIGVAVPGFVWALILQIVFGYWLRWFPIRGMFSLGVEAPPRITGFYTLDSLLTGRFDTFCDLLYHMILPAISLCIGVTVQEARILRSGMVENKDKDYMLLAQAQGLPFRVLAFKYLFKPSVIPAVTVMGMDIAQMLGGSFIIEYIFDWRGFGSYCTRGILNKDLNVITSMVLYTGFIFALASIIVDLIVAYLDPRIRLGG